MKFKVGDRVVYIGNKSSTSTKRKIGDTFVIMKIYDNKGSQLGPIYYPDTEPDGEYEVDLQYASKLHKALS